MASATVNKYLHTHCKLAQTALSRADCTAWQNQVYTHGLVVPLFDEWHDGQATCIDQLLQNCHAR
ncbi:MAG: hypothetical protein AAF993_20910, partial [Pseudomonadota bacterium]